MRLSERNEKKKRKIFKSNETPIMTVDDLKLRVDLESIDD